MAGAGRGQPYDIRFGESFAQFAVFGCARSIFRGRRAANLMVSDFAKASRNSQFLDARDAFFVAGAGRGQPYGFRFCESFAQFAFFGLARCIFRGRRRTRPTLWSFFVVGAVRERKS